MDRPTPSSTATSSGEDEACSDRRPQKRPACDQDTIDRATKRRASKACLSCRNRKVRCDVVGRGVPCTNCRLDDVDCVVTESNRGRRPTNAGQAPAVVVVDSAPAAAPTITSTFAPTAAAVAAAAAAAAATPATHRHPPASRQSQADRGGLHGQAEPPGCPQSRMPSPPAHADEYMVSLSFEDNSATSRARGINGYPRQHGVELTSETSSPAASLTFANGGPLSTCRAPQLPVFVRPLSPHVTPEDLDYLAAKDALTIPDDALRNQLLRAYAEIVHPFMPSLDLHGFLESVLAPRPDSTSLLLFQAVMFAGVAFVDEDLLLSHGYASRKAARKVFFNRVRLLHGLDCESDRLTLVQTLLLMTYWYDNPKDDKDTWYWMGIALTLAQVSGLHRDPRNLPIPSREKQLRRRIWWSCVLRDRLLALGVRRPSRIRDSDFDVPLLCMDDFDLSPASDPLLGILGKSKMTDYNPAARATMAALCVDLAKLCVCLGHILHSQYTVTGAQAIGSEHFSSVSVVPERSEKQANELVTCDKELEGWFQDQDARSRYTAGSEPSPETADRIIRLHQSLLHMMYLTALGVLHRPSVFCSGHEADSGVTRRASRRKVVGAAIAMTKLAFDLEENDQLRFLSTSSIPAFLSAALIHILEIRSPDEEVRNRSIGRFYQCAHILHQLQETYASADSAIHFLERVLKVTGVKVPMLKMTPASRAGQQLNRMSQAGLPRVDCGAHPAEGRSASHDFQPIQPLSPLTNPFDVWQAAGSGGLWPEDIELPADVLAGSPYMGDWADLEGMIPPIMDCN